MAGGKSKDNIGVGEPENWAPIPGYAGYEVSDLGRIRSLDRLTTGRPGKRRYRGRVRKLSTNSDYITVGLYDEAGVTKTCNVHVFVATMFVPNPLGLPEVNHDDLDKHNNRATNLRWTTRSENMKHAVANGAGWYGRPGWKIQDRMRWKKAIQDFSAEQALKNKQKEGDPE